MQKHICKMESHVANHCGAPARASRARYGTLRGYDMIGTNKAMPRSAWEVKRKIHLAAAPANPADATTVERTLNDIDGVLEASANPAKGTILVRYLVTKTDYQTLEHKLEAAEFPPSESRWARFKSGWCQSLDLTGRENAGARPSACCNKPPTRA